MDLHITTEKKGGVLTVRVAGRLSLVGLGELRKACRKDPRVRLDLSHLLSADEAGTSLLASMKDAGADLVEVPPYIDLLLQARNGRTP